MKKLFLILLASVSILNAQFLELLQEGNLIELNQNPYFANWSYTELITNGNMSSSTGWTTGGTFAIGGGVASATTTTGGAETIQQNISAVVGDVISIKYDIIENSLSNADGFYLSSAGIFGLLVLPGTVGPKAIIKRVTQTGFLKFVVANCISGTLVLDNVSLKKLIAPTGWTASAMDATNYVLQSSGCKFVEATGTTYIETSSALKKGMRKFKVTQDWTQGRLSISNGTTSVNLSQADGTQTVSLYFDGTQKMKVECTNNTISTISLLSIK